MTFRLTYDQYNKWMAYISDKRKTLRDELNKKTEQLHKEKCSSSKTNFSKTCALCKRIFHSKKGIYISHLYLVKTLTFDNN